MAIYHLHAKVIGRNQGRSAIAAAAYRSASKLFDKRQGMEFDYSNKLGVVYSEIFAPEEAPHWVKERETLWNEVEASEIKRNAQLAREIEVAIPLELTQEQAIILVSEFVKENFVAKGMIADINIHWDNQENPHAHILLTTRNITPLGFSSHKNRTWNSKDKLHFWRKSWGLLANHHLRKAGFDIRIDHRSYAEQGIKLEPTFHLGSKLFEAKQNNEVKTYQRVEDYYTIIRRNGNQIIDFPEIGLDLLTAQQSVFTDNDIAKLAHRYSVDENQYERIKQAIVSHSNTIYIGQTDNGKRVYSSRDMVETEYRMLKAASALHQRDEHGVEERFIRQAIYNQSFTETQFNALQHILKAGDLKVVVGFAGTGKSTMLKSAKLAWEAQGFRVKGAALSGIASNNLQDAGIQSRTLDSLLLAIQKGADGLSSSDVLVIDEAGMVDSRKLESLLVLAEQAKSKVILLGDPEQLQPILAGAPFRAIAHQVGFAEMNEVVRQYDPQSEQRTRTMRQATQDFALGKTADAINAYEHLGALFQHETRENALHAIIQSWNRDRHHVKGQLMLAFTRQDVSALNEQARMLLKSLNALKPNTETVFLVRNREGDEQAKRFAVNERIYFLQNNRQLGVSNGTLATITHIDKSTVTAKLDTGTVVCFNLRDYNSIDYGYAATIHKSQGVTVDKAYLLADKYLDRHASYVGCTRHRLGLEIHYDVNTFANKQALIDTLSREKGKDMVLDFASTRQFDTLLQSSVYEQENKAERASAEALLENYLNKLIALDEAVRQKVLHMVSDPDKAKHYAAQTQALDKEITQLAQQAVAHPDIQQTLAQTKATRLPTLAELGGYSQLKDRLVQQRLTPQDRNLLVRHMQQKARQGLTQQRDRSRSR